MTNTKEKHQSSGERKLHRQRSSFFTPHRSTVPAKQPLTAFTHLPSDPTPRVMATRPSSSRRLSTAPPPLTSYLVEPASPSRSPALSSNGSGVGFPRNSTPTAGPVPDPRTKAHAVSFSSSTRFDGCRQRVNIAVAREDVEETMGASGVALLAAKRVPARPISPLVGGQVGHRLIRTAAAAAQEGPVLHLPNGGSGSLRSRHATRSLSPVNSLLPASATPSTSSSPPASFVSSEVTDGSVYAVDITTLSLMGFTLLSETMQSSLLSAPASPRSSTASALEMSLSVTHELPRANVVCLRAAAPSAEAPTLASRLVFKTVRGVSSDGVDDRRRTRGKRCGKSMPVTVTVDKAGTAASVDVRSSLQGEALVQDRRYLVDVPASNFAKVMSGAWGAEAAARKAAAPFGEACPQQQQQPPPPARRTVSSVDASTQSLFSMLDNNSQLISAFQGSRIRVASSDADVAPSATSDATAAVVQPPLRARSLTVELLEEEIRERRPAPLTCSRSAHTTTTATAEGAPSTSPSLSSSPTAAVMPLLPPTRLTVSSHCGNTTNGVSSVRGSSTSIEGGYACALPSSIRNCHHPATLPAPSTNVSSSIDISPTATRRHGEHGERRCDSGGRRFKVVRRALRLLGHHHHRRRSDLQSGCDGDAVPPASSLSAAAAGLKPPQFSPPEVLPLPFLTPMPSQRSLLPAMPTHTPKQAPYLTLPAGGTPTAAKAAPTAVGQPYEQQVSPLMSATIRHPPFLHRSLIPMSSRSTPLPPWSLATPGNSSQEVPATPGSTATAGTRTWGEAGLRTPNKAVSTPTHTSHNPSPLAALPPRPRRRPSDVNMLLPENTSRTASSAAGTPTAARLILPQLANDGGIATNERHAGEEKRATQLHVLHGAPEMLVIEAPVRPRVNLPRGSAMTALVRGHSGDVHPGPLQPPPQSSPLLTYGTTATSAPVMTAVSVGGRVPVSLLSNASMGRHSG